MGVLPAPSLWAETLECGPGATRDLRRRRGADTPKKMQKQRHSSSSSMSASASASASSSAAAAAAAAASLACGGCSDSDNDEEVALLRSSAKKSLSRRRQRRRAEAALAAAEATKFSSSISFSSSSSSSASAASSFSTSKKASRAQALVGEGVALAEDQLCRSVRVAGAPYAQSLLVSMSAADLESLGRLSPHQRAAVLGITRHVRGRGRVAPGERWRLALAGVARREAGGMYGSDYERCGDCGSVHCGCLSESEHDYTSARDVPAHRPVLHHRGEDAALHEDDVRGLATLVPAQLRAVNVVRMQAEAKSKEALPILEKRAVELGFSARDLERTMRYLADEAPIVVHLPVHVLGLLLSEGSDPHLRNQFSTGTSRGSLNAKWRRTWEARLFGGSYTMDETLPDADRPVYGCWDMANDPRGVGAATCYGEAFVRLRGVRYRTTITNCDSSCRSARRAVPEHCAHILTGLGDEQLREILRVGSGRRTTGVQGHGDEYREVQIHGPVPLVGNVTELVVDTTVAANLEQTVGVTVKRGDHSGKGDKEKVVKVEEERVSIREAGRRLAALIGAEYHERDVTGTRTFGDANCPPGSWGRSVSAAAVEEAKRRRASHPSFHHCRDVESAIAAEKDALRDKGMHWMVDGDDTSGERDLRAARRRRRMAGRGSRKSAGRKYSRGGASKGVTPPPCSCCLPDKVSRGERRARALADAGIDIPAPRF